MKSDRIIKHLDSILSRHQAAYDDVAFESSLGMDLPRGKMQELLTSAEAAIERYSPPDSAYVTNSRATRDCGNDFRLEGLIGIIEALRHDYEAGALSPIQELIRAEVFDDFLEMAEHLLDQGYKDPAAVIVGTVLEQHLRKICKNAAIDVEENGNPKKADRLNAELVAKDVYGKLDLKSVTCWLDLRNDAAHGRYDRYTIEQVRLLLLGVRDFINRVS